MDEDDACGEVTDCWFKNLPWMNKAGVEVPMEITSLAIS